MLKKIKTFFPHLFIIIIGVFRNAFNNRFFYFPRYPKN